MLGNNFAASNGGKLWVRELEGHPPKGNEHLACHAMPADVSLPFTCLHARVHGFVAAGEGVTVIRSLVLGLVNGLLNTVLVVP